MGEPPLTPPAGAAPRTPATAATAGTDGSPLKRLLSALLLSEGKATLEASRVERLLSSEYGEDVLKLCEMIAATGAGACSPASGDGTGNPPATPPPRPRLLLGAGDEEKDEVQGKGEGGESLPPPSTLPGGANDAGAASGASAVGSEEDDEGSDDAACGDEDLGQTATAASGRLEAVRRALLRLKTPPRQQHQHQRPRRAGSSTLSRGERHTTTTPPPAPSSSWSTHSSPARRVSVILDSEGAKTTAAAAAAEAVTPPPPPSLSLLHTPPRVKASRSECLWRQRQKGEQEQEQQQREGEEGGGDDDGQVRLFHHAIRRRQEAVAVYLLRHHATSSLASARDAQGRTALMLAAAHNLPSLLHTLLAPTRSSAGGGSNDSRGQAPALPLDPKATSHRGHRALCYAAMGGHIDCLALLLAHAAGGSPHNYQRALHAHTAPCGHSPLHHAVAATHLKAARWLVARGAGVNSRIRPSPFLPNRNTRRPPPRQQLQQLQEEERATPLHCAVRVYLRVKEEQQLARLAGVGAVQAAARAAALGARKGEEDGEGGERVGEPSCSLKEREERAFKLVRWLVEEGEADLLARDARGRTALDVVMASPLYQRPTAASSFFAMASPSMHDVTGGGAAAAAAQRGGDGGGGLLSSREGNPGRPTGTRATAAALAASSSVSDPGTSRRLFGKRSLSFSNLFVLGRRNSRVSAASSASEAGAAAAAAVAAAVSTPPPQVMMARAASGASAMSLGLNAAATLVGTTSVRRLAKYLALMQRKQRAVDTAFAELFDANIHARVS